MQVPNTDQEVKESLATVPIPAKASTVQFGSIHDSSAVLSTSPAAPSTVTDPMQIKSFGSISAASGEASPASPTVTKGNTPQRTDSPAPVAGKSKRKLNVSSLFGKAQLSSTPAPAPAPIPAVPVPAPQTQQQKQQNPSGPHQSSQDGPVIRPPPKHQGSYDSPSTRITSLPRISHQPNQTPPSMKQGTGSGSYQFGPPVYLRQPGNGGPGPNPSRSPNFNRAMTNGSMVHPSILPGAAAATPSQTPLTAMPPNMPPHMWGYYYPQPHYDPNAQSYYWQPHMPPPHMVPPPHNPQQTSLAMQPSNLPTPSQAPMAMPMSPRVPPIGVQQAAPQAPQSLHPSLPAGNCSSFIAKRPVLIKNSAGEMIDLADLSKKFPPKQEDASTADIAIQHKKLSVKKKKKKGKSNDVDPVNDDEVHVVEHSERAAVSATTNGSAAGAASAVMSLEIAKKQIQEYVKELFMLRHLGRAEEYFSVIPPKFRWCLVEELVHLAVDANELDLDLISEVFAVVAAKSLIDENQFSRGFSTQMECLETTIEYSPNAYNAVARLLRSSKLSQAAVERLTDKMEAVVITPKEKLLKKYALFP